MSYKGATTTVRKLIQNAARCKKCGDMIVSTHRHHFQWCKCHTIFVDGGLDYIRCGGDLDSIEDCSKWEGTDDAESE